MFGRIVSGKSLFKGSLAGIGGAAVGAGIGATVGPSNSMQQNMVSGAWKGALTGAGAYAGLRLGKSGLNFARSHGLTKPISNAFNKAMSFGGSLGFSQQLGRARSMFNKTHFGPVQRSNSAFNSFKDAVRTASNQFSDFRSFK